jgi:hypothetical protein
MQTKPAVQNALFPVKKPNWLIAFLLCFFLSLVQHSSFDNENRKLAGIFAKLVVHATDLLTVVDGLFLFKVVEALWEGDLLPWTLHATKRWGTKAWLFENRPRVVDQNQLFESFENHGYISESVL